MSKSSAEPKNVIFVGGVYFDEFKDDKSNKGGFLLYHEQEGFKKRLYQSKDRTLISKWARALRH